MKNFSYKTTVKGIATNKYEIDLQIDKQTNAYILKVYRPTVGYQYTNLNTKDFNLATKLFDDKLLELQGN